MLSTENLAAIVVEFSRLASMDINEQLGLESWHDQTRSNRCDLLTKYVLEGLINKGFSNVHRELHQDPETLDWHLLLAHRLSDTPTEDDIISDLNPWRGSPSHVTGILHGPRKWVMSEMRQQDVPAGQITLRASSTIVSHHYPDAGLPRDFKTAKVIN